MVKWDVFQFTGNQFQVYFRSTYHSVRFRNRTFAVCLFLFCRYITKVSFPTVLVLIILSISYSPLAYQFNAIYLNLRDIRSNILTTI